MYGIVGWVTVSRSERELKNDSEFARWKLFDGKRENRRKVEKRTIHNMEQWNELFRIARAQKFNSLKKLNALNWK